VRLLLIGAKAVDFGAQFVTQLLEAITDKLNERLAPDAIMFGQHAALKHFVLLQRSGDALVDQASPRWRRRGSGCGSCHDDDSLSGLRGSTRTLAVRSSVARASSMMRWRSSSVMHHQLVVSHATAFA
jgi:hypothetical protein